MGWGRRRGCRSSRLRGWDGGWAAIAYWVEETTTLLDLHRAPCIRHGKASTPWIYHGKATMAGVEVGDDTLGWKTHIGPEMGRGRRLHRSPYCVLELRLRREMGEDTALS